MASTAPIGVFDSGVGGLTVLDAMRAIIEAEPLAKIDYVKMVDFENIVQIDKIEDVPVLCAMAVYIGKTRLIDNFIFGE